MNSTCVVFLVLSNLLLSLGKTKKRRISVKFLIEIFSGTQSTLLPSKTLACRFVLLGFSLYCRTRWPLCDGTSHDYDLFSLLLILVPAGI